MCRNDGGTEAFMGAAPPQGDQVHRYFFVGARGRAEETLGVDGSVSPAVATFTIGGHLAGPRRPHGHLRGVSAPALEHLPVLQHLDLVAAPVARALLSWPGAEQVTVMSIDPAISDTAALVEATGMPLESCANCVVVGGKRAGEERVAACVVLATTRADVNRRCAP